MKVLILRLAAAKSCRASEAEVDFIGHITPLSLVFRDGGPVWIPLIEDLTISYDHCVVEPRLTRRLVEICSFREYPPTCRRRERDLLTTARRNECVSPFVASSVVHEDRRRPGWLQSASLISRARPATPGARALDLRPPRTHPRNGQPEPRSPQTGAKGRDDPLGGQAPSWVPGIDANDATRRGTGQACPLSRSDSLHLSIRTRPYSCHPF